MNGYWKKDEVSVAEAMEMAQGLWALCREDIREHGRYWRKGGNAKMGMAGAPGARVTVWFSPWMRRSGVTVERQGLKESMTYSPDMTLLEADMGWFSGHGAWKYEPSRREETGDLRRACEAALEGYKKKFMQEAKDGNRVE